ncbi:hypothetical protein Tco_1134984 [Tanacetum coccineum]
MEAFIGGLPKSIKVNVTASKPQTLEEAITITLRLMDQVTKHDAEQGTNDHKRKFDDRRNNNNTNYPNNYDNNNYPNDRNNNNYQNNHNNKITTVIMITTSSKMEGRKPSGLMETVDIMDLIPCVGIVHCITQDLALSGVRIDFQDSPDDEEDTKSSHEYLNDLEEKYQARALLANSRRFFKKGTQSSSQHKPELRPTKDFEAKYNKVKAKLALLSSSASVSKAATVKNKVLMELAEENDAINKEGARNGKWVKISMRKESHLVPEQWMLKAYDWFQELPA